MRNPLTVLVCVLVLLLAACGERPMSKRAFTEKFAHQLQQAAPGLHLEIKGDLEIKITGPGHEDGTAFLDNSYNLYVADPSSLDKILADYVTGGLAALTKETSKRTLDRSLIVPVIKDRAWIADTHKAMQGRGADAKDLPDYVFEALNDELVIVYAEDSPKSVSYVTAKTIAGAGLKKEELRTLAVENLKRLLPKVEAKGGQGVYIMTADGSYEASLLLFDSIWQERNLKVEGDYVVAVPSRELLLITGTGEKQGLKKVRELAQSVAAEAPYRLTADLFVYRNGRFVKFED